MYCSQRRGRHGRGVVLACLLAVSGLAPLWAADLVRMVHPASGDSRRAGERPSDAGIVLVVDGRHDGGGLREVGSLPVQVSPWSWSRPARVPPSRLPRSAASSFRPVVTATTHLPAAAAWRSQRPARAVASLTDVRLQIHRFNI